jgi:hypothetical protein
LVIGPRHRTSKMQDENTPLRKWSRDKPSQIYQEAPSLNLNLSNNAFNAWGKDHNT